MMTECEILHSCSFQILLNSCLRVYCIRIRFKHFYLALKLSKFLKQFIGMMINTYRLYIFRKFLPKCLLTTIKTYNEFNCLKLLFINLGISLLNKLLNNKGYLTLTRSLPGITARFNSNFSVFTFFLTSLLLV